jgi:hypothetical protein
MKYLRIIQVVLLVTILLFAVACKDSVPTQSTPTSATLDTPPATPSPTMMPTAFPSPTPLAEAMLGVPVSNGQRQMILRSVSTANSVSQDLLGRQKATWRAATDHQYVLITGDHRGLNDITDGTSGVIFGWYGELENKDGEAVEASGLGVGDQFCAECQAMAVLVGDRHGSLTYLFEIPQTWNRSDLTFSFAGFPPVALREIESMPETRIPFFEGIQPPQWDLMGEPALGNWLTYFNQQGSPTLWASDETGNNTFPFATRELSYGWAKFSPDGQRALVVTQPEIGWMDLYLFSHNGHYAYPLVLNAEWVDARFSPDGRFIIFSVDTIRSRETNLYVAHADGSAVQRVELEDELLYFRPAAVGDRIAVVTTNWRAGPIILAGGLPFTGGELFQNRHKTLYMLDLSANNLTKIASDRQLQVFRGGRYWLVAQSSGSTLEQGKIQLFDTVENTGRMLYEDTFGAGCVAPNDSHLLVTSEHGIELFATDNLGESIPLLADAEGISDFVACEFSADAQYLWFLAFVRQNEAEDQAERVLFVVDSSGNTVTQLGGVVKASFSVEGDRLAYTLTTAEDVQKVYVANVDGSESRLLGSGLLVDWRGKP